MGLKIFTREELVRFDGKEERPAYIGFEKHVYDVSFSYFWKNGDHYLVHKAGTDLTHDLKQAPHGMDLLKQFPIVGRIK